MLALLLAVLEAFCGIRTGVGARQRLTNRKCQYALRLACTISVSRQLFTSGVLNAHPFVDNERSRPQRPLLGQPQNAKAMDGRPSLPKAAPPGEGVVPSFHNIPLRIFLIPVGGLAVSGQLWLHQVKRGNGVFSAKVAEGVNWSRFVVRQRHVAGDLNR